MNVLKRFWTSLRIPGAGKNGEDPQNNLREQLAETRNDLHKKIDAFLEEHTDDPPRVLYVDDEETDRFVFEQLFRGRYKVFTAASVKEALRILGTEDIQVVISDVRMPEEDGAEFLKRVSVSRPQAVKILTSAHKALDSVSRAISECSVFQFVPKPWNFEKLKEIIEESIHAYKNGSFERKEVPGGNT